MKGNWVLNRRPHRDGRGETWRIESNGSSITLDSFFRELTSNSSARATLLKAWHDTSFDSFVWEMPRLDQSKQDNAFECVVLNEPALFPMRASSSAFSAHFAHNTSSVAFANLGGDALLVAPAPKNSKTDYAHLGAFVRSCINSEAHDLLILLGLEVLKRCSSSGVWVSTSGLGVPWLHFRLDEHPKYYQHEGYRYPSAAIEL